MRQYVVVGTFRGDPSDAQLALARQELAAQLDLYEDVSVWVVAAPDERPTVPCGYCNRTFSKQSGRSAHVSRTHPTVWKMEQAVRKASRRR